MGLAAVIQGCDGRSDRDARASLVRALRHAGDPRLLPVLHHVLDGEELDLAMPAARGIGLPLAESLPAQLLSVHLGLKTGWEPGTFRYIGKITLQE